MPAAKAASASVTSRPFGRTHAGRPDRRQAMKKGQPAANPCGRRYIGCAVYATHITSFRTACLHMTMCDKIALSVILLFIEGMAQISEQNTENDVQEPSAPSDSTAVSGDLSAAGMSSGLPSPLPEITGDLPAHLRKT
jgi:hypothetical protein